MANDVVSYLIANGPARSSLIAEAFVASGAAAATARKRLSRSGDDVLRFPIPLLPKREDFLYLKSQRNSEQFWANFLRDLRASESVFGAAIDGVAARGGLVRADEFDVISGSPTLPMKGQLSTKVVSDRLLKAGFLQHWDDPTHGPCFELSYDVMAAISPSDLTARRLAEGVVLDGLREWVRYNGFAGFDSIAVRGEGSLRPIGPFAFDLAGPSYLLPLRHSKAPGFFVADVFVEGTLTEHQIQFFIRKCRMLKATRRDMGVLGMLVADSFTGAALSNGHAAGIVMATPRTLFGPRVGNGMASLVETLKNAAAYAASESPNRLVSLIEDLATIEGSAGNLRGILFELIAGYLARRDSVSIDLGITAKDVRTGRHVDSDVQAVKSHSSAVTAIECKGKGPGTTITLSEVEEWLSKIPVIHAHYRAHSALREAKVTCELWTSARFESEALERLTREKAKRVKRPIDWKDGAAVVTLAAVVKEKAISDALYQHFVTHPLARVSSSADSRGLPRPAEFPKEVHPYLEYVAFKDPPPSQETAGF